MLLSMTKQYDNRSPAKMREYRLRYTAKPDNRLKLRAHWRVRYALRNGTLVRQPCEKCGALPSDAHHDNYLKPLDVRWLCKKHHAEQHSGPRAYSGRDLAEACRRGHPYTEENTGRWPNGRRQCRICRKRRNKPEV
jgi:hypothetical protein